MTTIQNNYCTTDYCYYSYCAPTELTPLNIQYLQLISGFYPLNIQYRMVSYNINNLRILWEIKSDGIEAVNFFASSSASSDKNVLNLKSDQIERYWQSNTATNEWVRFDAGAGLVISLDTFGLIGHNLTSSAVVTLQGYGQGGDSVPADWNLVPIYATLTMSDDPDELNLIWISPAQPTNSYRHWRLNISDSTNPSGYIRAGRLVAGSALIFNGENCLDEISLIENNFKDKMQLNGFSSVANNRALKRSLEISFRNLDRVSQTNYRLLKRYLRYCRDTLKALVIVDPSSDRSKYQFTTFAKLKMMPTESHKYVDAKSSYTSFGLEYDEGQ